MSKTEKRQIGDLGEEITALFLKKHKYKVLDRNYFKKWGEIDVVAKKKGKIYFIEVKTVTRENISRESRDQYQAEDNVHSWKLKRLERTMNSWLSEKGLEDVDFQLDLVVVEIEKGTSKARIRYIPEIA